MLDRVLNKIIIKVIHNVLQNPSSLPCKEKNATVKLIIYLLHMTIRPNTV